MPQINRTLYLEITVEQFLNACSPLELREVDILIQSNRYIKKMNEEEKPAPWVRATESTKIG